MARSLFNAPLQIQPGTITRALHNTTTAGSAVINKVIAGTGITITNTGVDAGTGDVTVNATGQSASPITGIGYATGAGGTVAQATSKATGVTLSKTTGTITMNAASLAAATVVSFVLTNTSIAATDLLLCEHVSGGTAGAYSIAAFPAAGSATISVRNNTAGALLEAIVLRFSIFKSVNA
jgi:hypothetical protein